MINITSNFLCLMILFLVCLSFGYSLHANQEKKLRDDQYHFKLSVFDDTLLVCLSFGYSLHGNEDEESCIDVVSNAKVMKHVDAMKKVQRRGKSGEEFGKETAKMTMKKTTKKETSVEEEDDLVAFTADYWKPRHHPPKNN